jgi:Ca-activated chloride channel homolog
MKHRLTSVSVLAGVCALYGVTALSQLQKAPPTQALQTSQAATPAGFSPVSFRSPDGKISGWRVTIPGNRPLATPAIADGKVFLGGGFGSHEFYALDAETGKPLWTYRTADDGPTAAVVAGDKIAFTTESCELEIITTSGRPVWKKWLGDPLMSMPAIADGILYMAYPNSRGDHKYYVAAFDLGTGKERWKHPLADEIITAPVVDRDGLYIATLEGSVLALDRQNGTQLWQEQRNATSAPTVWKDQVYFSRREEVKGGGKEKATAKQTEMVAVRPLKGIGGVRDLPATQHDADYLDYQKRAASKTEVASQALDGTVGFGTSKGAALMAMAQKNIGQASVHGIWAYQGSKTFIDHSKLYGSMGDRTQSVDPESGRVIWSRVLNDSKKTAAADGALTPPAIVNGKVFVGNNSGDLYVLSASTGEVLWTAHLGEAISFQPAVAGGKVYIATNEGTLYCLNTKDSGDDGWLMWGGSAGHNGPTERVSRR